MGVSYYIVPGLVFFSIWFPVLRHYRVGAVNVTDQMVESAFASPTDEVFHKLDGFRLTDLKWSDHLQVLSSAEKLLKGEVDLPGLPATTIRLPFDAKDIDRGTATWQLLMAGFFVPDVLLRAYKMTGRDQFFLTARDAILGWASYEASAWLPRGFLWNDHAVASRVIVLAEFWRYYRHRPDYEVGVARAVLQMAARSAELLSRPQHFTFGTNHGVMQNLALWHYCLAFPSLPEVERYKRLALSRMRDQMDFYVNAEGVVLEHSAGYQAFGLELMGRAFTYLALLGEPIPTEWRRKHDQAERFYAQLKRPDGSFPVFGDTDGSAYPLGAFAGRIDAERTSKPDQATALYPDAGYSIWWDGLEKWPGPGGLSQTVVTWSYFPGHVHKHADEMSVLLWAGGESWWTGTGYWPYGAEGRLAAASWSGSNAPHLVNEPTDSLRQTRLVSYGSASHLALIELQRTGPGEYLAHRQVVQWKPHLWLIIDATSGDDHDRTTTTWTTFPSVRLRRGMTVDSYRLKGERSTSTLAAFILGPDDMIVREVAGSLAPFGGWTVIDYLPTPAPALIVEQPASNGWSFLVSSLEDEESPSRLVGVPHARWGGVDDWRITLPMASGSAEISRRGREIHLAYDGKVRHSESLELTIASTPTDALGDIAAGYNAAAKKYPRFPEIPTFRTTVTCLLILAFVLQEVFFYGYRSWGGRYYRALRIFNSCGWASVAAWLHITYMRS